MLNKPLAFRSRPKNLDEVIGQEECKKFLYNLKKNNSLVNMIFYGPPGTGKTTLAYAFSNSMNLHSIYLNATIDKKENIEYAFKEAINLGPSIVIIDEIHRLDKAKQDLLLPHLENGDFYLIGCTTANPYVSLNSAIRSRTKLINISFLSKEEIFTFLKKVSTTDEIIKNKKIDDEVLKYIASISSGDMRYALNQLEVISLSFSNSHQIKLEEVKELNIQTNYLADKNEDEHYNTVSAMQKSIRGSEVDAALYYLAKLLSGGDLEGTIRRLLVTAYEDVGLANPEAVNRCYHACETALKVGLPEAYIPLGFSIIDLSLSPKSKSANNAISKARESIDNTPRPVRNYLFLHQESLDPSERYDYSDPRLWPILEYLPHGLENISFYIPSDTGKYERALKERYEELKKHKRFTSVKEARDSLKK